MSLLQGRVVMIGHETPFEELHVNICPSVLTHQTI